MEGGKKMKKRKRRIKYISKKENPNKQDEMKPIEMGEEEGKKTLTRRWISFMNNVH